MKRIEIILYVANQENSKKFYTALLKEKPILDVPGMTSFQLTENTYLLV